ncbi:hypothetical protein [Burkholderia multivorans]|uniref:hypothetical protein n=1 Tax=Burkholderia multivorans TaxID=87883 RepID=UPI00128E9CF5|nr:hypothetical protein [Burkholderia multivorans]
MRMIIRILARYRFAAQSSVNSCIGVAAFPDEKPEPSIPLHVARRTPKLQKQRISEEFPPSLHAARHAGNANPDANFQCESFVIFFAERE